MDRVNYLREVLEIRISNFYTYNQHEKISYSYGFPYLYFS